MDPSTPFIVGKNTVITSAATGVLAGVYGLSKGYSQIGPLVASSAVNGGIAGATFFSVREYITGPLLLLALSNTRYSRRIRELHDDRAAGRRPREKLSWWDMRMFKVPDTVISGVFTGGILNSMKRGRAGILTGVATGGIVCTLLQLAYNELGIARIKYVSRMLQAQQRPPQPELPVSQPLPPPSQADIEPPNTFLERALTTLGWHKVSDEEYLEKLKFKRDVYLRKIAQLEKEREREREIERSQNSSESSSN